MYGFLGFIGIVFGLWAFIRTNRHQREIEDLKKKLFVLTNEKNASEVTGSRGVVQPTEPARADQAEETFPEPLTVPSHNTSDANATAVPLSSPAGGRQAPPPPPPDTPTSPPPSNESLEEALTSRWMVWLGGVTVALGGAFLVKYSLDQGWLGPIARVSFGILFGSALVIAGEWLRHRPLQQEIARIRPNYVAPALSAAGFSIAFAATYAAYGLYGLIGPLVSFTLLAAISVTAIGFSLLQGPFIAALGLGGSLIVPLLVASDTPNPIGFYSYIFVISLSCFVVTRFRDWPWLSIAAITGVFLWTALWLRVFLDADHSWVIGGFLVALLAATYALVFQLPMRAVPREKRSPNDLNALLGGDHLAWAGFALMGVLAVNFLHRDDYSQIALATAGAVVLLTALFCRRAPLPETLGGGAALLSVVAVAGWGLAPDTSPPPGEFDASLGLLPVAPASTFPFLWTSLAASMFWGVYGYWASRDTKRPLLWASCSVLVPLLLMVCTYLRLQDYQESLSWGAIAMGLAGLATLIVATMAKPNQPVTDERAAIYAVGAIAAISLAFAMTLEKAFLTVALAAQLPAIGWVYVRFAMPLLRWAATIVAGIVLIRLALNPFIFTYEIDGSGLFNWVLYGYGLPALAFAMAYRWFRDEKNSWPTPLLESGTILFTVLLVTFEIRFLFEGKLDSSAYTLFEASLQTLNWLTASLVLYWQAARHPNQLRLIASYLLLGLAGLHILLIHYLELNPMFEDEHIWGIVFVNLLLVAYGVPAVFMGVYAWLAHRLKDQTVERLTGIGALVLLFTYVSLEVRHLFRGADLSAGSMSDAESYGYSLAWLLLAGVLVGAAIWRKVTVLRYASLAVVGLAITKVFLVDAATLPGIWRALSFLGLGLSLIGLGYLYQRFVFPPASKQEPPSAAAV